MDNIKTLVTILYNKTRTIIVDTTDIKVLNDILWYDEGDDEFYVDKIISIVMDEKGHTQKFKVTDVIFHYFKSEFINENRTFQGATTPYNTQVVVHVDDAE
jgi:hypothetical protein